MNSRIVQIEGLRAVCVLLVLVFHIDPTLLPAGYLGVDAFFAISGFVITRMIVVQKAEGKFTFAGFYRSRAVRLLPAMTATVLATALVFSWIYTRSDLIRLMESTIAASISLSNIYFYLDAGYFSEDAIYKPLLHTWSLGVEEQFYLVWPLFLVFLLGRRAARFPSLAVLSLALFALAAVAARSDADAAFYLTPFRMYQFALGAAFAFLSRQPPVGPGLRQPFAWATVGAMVAISLLDPAPGLQQVALQGLMTLLVAAACWVFAVTEREVGASRASLLGNRASVFLGARSYAIYLAHWPLVTAAYAYGGGWPAEPLGRHLVLFAGSIALGVLLAETIERPLRYRRDTPGDARNFRFGLTLGTVFAAVFAGALGLGLLRDTGAETVVAKKPTKQDLLAEYQVAEERHPCAFDLRQAAGRLELGDCLRGDRPNIVVAGDSLSRGPWLGLSRRFPEVNFIRVYRAGCPPYFGNDEARIRRMTDRLASCRHPDGFVWAFALRELERLQGEIDGLLVSGNWNARSLTGGLLFENPAALAHLDMTVAIAGVQPWLSDEAPRAYERGTIDPATNDLEPLIPKEGYGSAQRGLHKKLREATTRSGEQYLDIYDVLCAPGCIAFDAGGKLLYLDNSHLSVAGADFVAGSGVFDGFVKSAGTAGL